MEMDVVDKITFTGGQTQGEIIFSYMQDIEQVSREFATPRHEKFCRTAEGPAGDSLALEICKRELVK